jgi:deoxycytidylate deaminase
MIINSGIREVVYNESYTIDTTARRILAEAGVVLRPVSTEK